MARPQKPVSKKYVPDYEQFVKEQMHLQRIGNKLRAAGYGSSEAFLADIKKIHANAALYNKPGNGKYGLASKCPAQQEQ